jgi:hypothetical protein
MPSSSTPQLRRNVRHDAMFLNWKEDKKYKA